MSVITFSKYHSYGNDYICVDNTKDKHDWSTFGDTIRRICSRRTGVGSDGLVEIHNSFVPDCLYKLVFYNPRGQIGTFAGNASRCSVAFAHDLGLFTGETVCFEASDGSHHATYQKEDQHVRLQMADVEIHKIDHNNYFLDTGSPHHVRFMDDLSEIDVDAAGRAISHADPYKPNGTNVDFVNWCSENLCRIRTYDRGVDGEILACGTGSVASAIATYSPTNPCIVEASSCTYSACVKQEVIGPGGKLFVEFCRKSETFYTGVYLSGPIQHAFDGAFYD